jgi:hypothetical protein
LLGSISTRAIVGAATRERNSCTQSARARAGRAANIRYSLNGCTVRASSR